MFEDVCLYNDHCKSRRWLMYTHTGLYVRTYTVFWAGLFIFDFFLVLQTSGKDRAQAFVFALQSQARLNRSLLWKDAWSSNIPHVFLFSKQFNIAYNLTRAQKCLLFQSRADCLTRMFKQLGAGNITACVHTCVYVCVCARALYPASLSQLQIDDVDSGHY